MNNEQELVRSVFPTSELFLHCPRDLSMEYFDVHSFRVPTMGAIASLIFLTFSSCLKGTVMQIEKALINDHLYVSKVP